MLAGVANYCAGVASYYLGDSLQNVECYKTMTKERLVSLMAAKKIGMTDNLCVENTGLVKTVLSGAIAGDNLDLVKYICTVLTTKELEQACYCGPRVKVEDPPTSRYSFNPINYSLTFEETPNRLEMLKNFLECGVDPNLHKDFSPALVYAGMKHSPKVISLLVEHGATLGDYRVYEKEIIDKLWTVYRVAFLTMRRDETLPKELSQEIQRLFMHRVAPKSI